MALFFFMNRRDLLYKLSFVIFGREGDVCYLRGREPGIGTCNGVTVSHQISLRHAHILQTASNAARALYMKAYIVCSFVRSFVLIYARICLFKFYAESYLRYIYTASWNCFWGSTFVIRTE